jgi:hypothetical protein
MSAPSVDMVTSVTLYKEIVAAEFGITANAASSTASSTASITVGTTGVGVGTTATTSVSDSLTLLLSSLDSYYPHTPPAPGANRPKEKGWAWGYREKTAVPMPAVWGPGKWAPSVASADSCTR